MSWVVNMYQSVQASVHFTAGLVWVHSSINVYFKQYMCLHARVFIFICLASLDTAKRSQDWLGQPKNVLPNTVTGRYLPERNKITIKSMVTVGIS